MVAIRRTQGSDDFAPDAVLDLPHGAELETRAAKFFPPKFGDDGSLWKPVVSLRLRVADDGTEEGEDDGKEFLDRFELKPDSALGYKPEDLKTLNRANITEAQAEALLDVGNWTVRDETKIDNMLICLFGRKWLKGEVEFDLEHLEDLFVGKRFIAKVSKRNGKKPGSICGWDSFVSVERPKKKNNKKGAEGIDVDSDTARELDELPMAPEEEAAMKQALG